nr:phospholipase-like protein [Tanacetum cinerariifolium]
MAQELCTRVKERGELISQLYAFNLSDDAFESLKLIKQLQEHDMAKTKSLMKAITETHLRVLGRERNAGVQILLQDSIPVWYADGSMYKVIMPINETDMHGCLTQLDLRSGVVTFYDSGITYDHEWRDWITWTFTFSEDFCAELKKEFIELTDTPLFGVFPSLQDQNSNDDVIKELSRPNMATYRVRLTNDFNIYLGQRGPLQCRFPWCKDVCVDRRFWESLACLDPAKKGWIMDEEHSLLVTSYFYVDGI